MKPEGTYVGTHKVLTQGDNKGHHSPRLYSPRVLLYPSLMWWRIQTPPEDNSQPPVIRKREEDWNPLTLTGTKGKFLGNRNKYGFHSASFIPSYPQSLTTSYICLAHSNQTMLNFIIKIMNMGLSFRCNQYLECPNHISFLCLFSQKSLPRAFWDVSKHLSHICRRATSGPLTQVGLMSPWTPKDEEGLVTTAAQTLSACH